MHSREGAFLGSRKGIGFEIVGIVVALLILLFWASVQSTVSTYTYYAGGWRNFLNWAGSGQGQQFGSLLIVAMLLVLLVSVVSIASKMSAAREEYLAERKKSEEFDKQLGVLLDERSKVTGIPRSVNELEEEQK